MVGARSYKYSGGSNAAESPSGTKIGMQFETSEMNERMGKSRKGKRKENSMYERRLSQKIDLGGKLSKKRSGKLTLNTTIHVGQTASKRP